MGVKPGSPHFDERITETGENCEITEYVTRMKRLVNGYKCCLETGEERRPPWGLENKPEDHIKVNR